jgi:hypothetical protein
VLTQKLFSFVILLIFFSIQLQLSNAFTCEKVCSEKNHYRKEPAYHAQVSLRTPAARGKTQPRGQRMFFKRALITTEFDLPSVVDDARSVLLRERV